MGLIPKMGCEGVGPATVYHPEGNLIPPASQASGVVVGPVLQSAPPQQTAQSGSTQPVVRPVQMQSGPPVIVNWTAQDPNSNF
jgi:hypothetical protein